MAGYLETHRHAMRRRSSSQAPASAVSPSRGRLAWVDALRGFALVWMTVFHFCFDLTQHGILQANFYESPFWTLQRSAIVTIFLVCAGLGQVLAHEEGVAWPRFWRRWAQIAGCALLVSAASWFMFPQSYIYFGILHGMAVMLLIARLWAAWPWWALAVAGLAVWGLHDGVPLLHQQWPLLDFLNGRAWNWLGLISHKPVTEDYVPLVPWMGTLWLAMALGKRILTGSGREVQGRTSRLLSGPLRGLFSGLSALGRWSLVYYMVHQPVMLGMLMLALR